MMEEMPAGRPGKRPVKRDAGRAAGAGKREFRPAEGRPEGDRRRPARPAEGRPEGARRRPARPAAAKSAGVRKRSSKPVASKAPEETVRLNKFIANSGVCARREADELIKQGYISVNGKKVTDMGIKVKPADKVEYRGKLLSPGKRSISCSTSPRVMSPPLKTRMPKAPSSTWLRMPQKNVSTPSEDLTRQPPGCFC